MDPKHKTGSQKVSKCQSDDDRVDTDYRERPSTSYNCTLIRLEGTHTTATETDEPTSGVRLFPTNENLPNKFLTSKQMSSQNFNITAEEFPQVQKPKPSSQDFENKLPQEEGVGRKTKTDVSKKPVEEVIHEMSENIQTIIGMFGPKTSDNNKQACTSKPGKRVSFQGSKPTSKPAGPHRSRFDQFIEDKKNFPRALRDNIKLERNDTGQENLVAECSRTALYEEENHSRESSLSSCKITDVMHYTNTARKSIEPGNITENLDITTADATNVSRTKIPEPDIEDVVIPMYEGVDGRSMSLQPCEHTFHTLHIEAASSPTSSVMYRPPLCIRLWRVITDLITGICLCLQVNRDCIFCLGFFVAFVVSASFLTAFFYRTLNVNPQGLQHSSLRKDAIEVKKPMLT